MAGKGSKKKRPPARRPAAKPAGAPANAAGTPQKAAPAKAAPDAGARRSKPTQAERLEAARRARRRKALRVRLGAAGAVLAVVALVVTLVVADRREERNEQQRLTGGSCDYDTRADRLTASNRHVPPARYEVDPPAGGDHDPSAVPANIFSEGGTLPADAQLVHSLEHGFVILWHRPGLTEAEMADIRAVYDEHGEDVLVVPRASLDVKVAATSWGRRLLCGEVERDTLSEFVELYRNKSPEPGVR